MCDYFVRCSMCGTTWKSRDDFLTDCSLELNGYQVNFADLEHGLFYFTHCDTDCHSTMAVETHFFSDLSEKRYEVRKKGGDECPGYCLFKDNTEPCPTECDCAYVRDIMKRIHTLKKRAARS